MPIMKGVATLDAALFRVFTRASLISRERCRQVLSYSLSPTYVSGSRCDVYQPRSTTRKHGTAPITLAGARASTRPSRRTCLGGRPESVGAPPAVAHLWRP